MAVKKKAKTKKPEPKKAEAKQKFLEREDAMILQISYRELENISLRVELTQLRLEKLNSEKDKSSEQLRNINRQLNDKYGLDPEKDKIELITGEITRG